MSEEIPLQIEMTSSGKASEKQTDPACEGLHEDIDKRKKKLIQQPEHICFQYCCRSCSWKVIITFFIVLLAVFFLIFMTVKLPGKGGKQTEQLGHKLMSQCGLPCPRFWIGYEGKCYYFSRENQDWTSSHHHCSSHNASLARTEKEEMDFVMRLKGKDIYWIGLRRVLSKDWTWSDGEKATMEVIGGGGGCAFLDDTGKAIASGCHTKLPWICTKPAAYTKQEFTGRSEEDATTAGQEEAPGLHSSFSRFQQTLLFRTGDEQAAPARAPAEEAPWLVASPRTGPS